MKRRTDKPLKRDCVAVLIRLPKDEHRQLRVIAARDGMSMARWVETLTRPMIRRRAKELDIDIEEERDT